MNGLMKRTQLRATRLRVAACVAIAFAFACGSPARGGTSPDASPPRGSQKTELAQAHDREVARIRAATAAFKSLDKAVAAGYQREVAHCVDNLPAGAMGFHHQNSSLLDDRVELEHPEMLVYERLRDGEYRLNGVEYIVPLSAWTSDEPPTVMGQELKRAPSLGIWYRHVWVWRDNPSGLFADWNPLVKC